MPEKVLIIDDEPALTVALMTRFECAGFDVAHAINGLAGLEAAELERPDAIVLDVRMPDIDGFEVCRRIRAHAELGETPIVFLSASVQDDARRCAMDSGGNAFLSKPFEAADVIEAVRGVLSLNTSGEQELTSHA